MNDEQLFHMMEKAEQYLVNVIKQGTPCKTMDELCHWQYHQSKNVTIK